MFTINKHNAALNYTRAVIIIITVATAWVFFEWLFFVTKPSFMNLYSAWEKVAVLAGTSLNMSVSLLFASLPFFALSWVLSRFTQNRRLLSTLALFPAVMLLTFTLLLLIDNFILTLVGWGIRNAELMGLWLFRGLSIALFVYTIGLMQRLLNQQEIATGFKAVAMVAGLIVLVGIPLFSMAIFAGPKGMDEGISETGRERPNILILSGDGIWAQHMSVYGYDRPTTPFMDSVRDEFLIAENHFSNAADTGGSMISMLSGKLPTTTRVIYPPDVLRGIDSFQHLPGLLKKLGYYNVDISMRHYADPYDLNMQGGFDEANFRKLTDNGILPVTLIRSYPELNSIALMTNQISERLAQRVGRIVNGKPIQDPFAEVNKPNKRFISDDARMVEIHRFVVQRHQPFFLHVHMMGTHGSRFRPRERIYSTKDSYSTDWDKDGYDDAIIDFDRYAAETYELLKVTGVLDSTIFIISSDHGFRHNPLHRIPMLLRMPGRSHTGYLGGNTQMLDIAPTLLEAIGLDVPDWMEGRSLLNTDVDAFSTRPVFASGSGAKTVDGDRGLVTSPQAPWYSLGRLYLVLCNQGFVLRTRKLNLHEVKIEGSTLNCSGDKSLDRARQLMLEHLQEREYMPES